MNGVETENSDLPSEDFASRLRQLRKERKLSQSALADRAGVHFTHISRYERGISRPSADTLHRLAEALGVTGDFLMEGTTDDMARARFEDRELLRLFREVEKFDDQDKAVVKSLLDAYIAKQKIRQMVAG